MKRRKYDKPSIIEAVCEFQFGPESPWNDDYLDLIHKPLRKTFPKSRSAQRLTVDTITAGKEIKQQAQSLSVMQFLQTDGKMLFQVAPYLLAVNHLAPYSSWHELLPIIKKCFNAYTKVASPTTFRRIGLRYINKIEIESSSVDMEAYFNFYPELKGNMPTRHGAFFVGVQIPYEDERDVLKVELTTALPIKEGSQAFQLSLDYVLVVTEKVDVDRAIEWVDNAHTNIELIFEACIKDPVRQLMQEVKE